MKTPHSKLYAAMGIFLCLLLAGCIALDKTVVVDEQQLNADGIKLIRPTSSSGDDPSAYLQDFYPIGSDTRLLIRREDLLERREDLLVGDAHPVTLMIRVVSAEDRATALAEFKLCPLAKNWMMLATWATAHPFRGGKWSEAGSDFYPDSCVTGLADADVLEDRRIVFDVTDHVERFLVGQGQSYGWVLISEGAPIVVDGDGNLTRSPRFKWDEKVGETYNPLRP